MGKGHQFVRRKKVWHRRKNVEFCPASFSMKNMAFYKKNILTPLFLILSITF